MKYRADQLLSRCVRQLVYLVRRVWKTALLHPAGAMQVWELKPKPPDKPTWHDSANPA